MWQVEKGGGSFVKKLKLGLRIWVISIEMRIGATELVVFNKEESVKAGEGSGQVTCKP